MGRGGAVARAVRLTRGATRGVPVQMDGFPLKLWQLHYARRKYDPEPTFTSVDDTEMKRLLVRTSRSRTSQQGSRTCKGLVPDA